MNKISYLFLAGILSFGLISCKDDAKEKVTGSDLDNQTTELTSEPVENTTSNVNTGEVMLNPPHGQPGHVCEIPVGEPLPGSGTAAAATSSTNSGVKLNPPHGQPGHRCEIPVGEPLPNDGGGTLQAAPANVNLTTPLMQQNQRLNPPHGEPGHVCEIPVGQPLP